MNHPMNDIPDIDSPSDEGAAEPRPSQAAETTDRATALERERDALQDRLLRLSAEFDNYRKRIDRERQETSGRAAASVLEEILPILDNLERALAAEPGGDGSESYRKGVDLIHRQLLDLLARRGVVPIDAIGTDFDPHLHQAVAHENSPGHRDGEVIEELRRGYLIGDRLLRPAMVKVAKA
jgi:molecular chaperone GrpE